MKPGESWAYRARRVDPLVEVRVKRHGTQKPARVLIHFVEDKFEGREEWVPPSRLKVPWEEVGDFEAKEARWDRMYELGPERDDPREYVVEELIDKYLDQDLVTVNYNDGYSLSITHVERLADELSLDLEELRSHSDAFTEDEKYVVPYPVSETVVRRVAELNAEELLWKLRGEEQVAQYQAIHGRYTKIWGGQERYISGEECAEFDAEHAAPIRKLLREWCGEDATARFDELAELRKEIKRVGDIAERAIEALREVGQDNIASDFTRELGTPVEMLRVRQPSGGKKNR